MPPLTAHRPRRWPRAERPRRPRRRGAGPLAGPLCALLAAAAAPALGGCSPEVTLEGSLGEVLDLTFHDVGVALTEWQVIVEYTQTRATDEGEATDIVLKLVARQVPSEVVPGKRIDLGPNEDGTPRAALTRAMPLDPVRTLADIKDGFLVLDAVPALDLPVSGEWRVTLGEHGDAGKGRTVFGRFKVDKVKPGN